MAHVGHLVCSKVLTIDIKSLRCLWCLQGTLGEIFSATLCGYLFISKKTHSIGKLQIHHTPHNAGKSTVTSLRFTDVLRTIFPVFLDGHCSKRGCNKQQVKMHVVMLFNVCIYLLHHRINI